MLQHERQAEPAQHSGKRRKRGGAVTANTVDRVNLIPILMRENI
ncbi:hypothetical protein I33_3870 [Bacillus subtilis subsp. subtilis str. RO-NN-1]|nr:hypothetical protein I33_3870 [Bacillus subtilis subsp. subtilis str. RO-NN-1]